MATVSSGIESEVGNEGVHSTVPTMKYKVANNELNSLT